MKPKKRASSLSKREKIRRKPFNRLNKRSTSLRLLYTSLSYSHGATRVESGGTTGMNPSSKASWRVSFPSYARSITTCRFSCGLSARRADRPQTTEQLAPLRCVVSLSGGEREDHCCSSICGNHMNLGGPSTPGLADGLRSVFFNAPVPSGCTLTIVLSSEIASSLIRTICSRCRCSNTLSSTLFLDQRFMRV